MDFKIPEISKDNTQPVFQEVFDRYSNNGGVTLNEKDKNTLIDYINKSWNLNVSDSNDTVRYLDKYCSDENDSKYLDDIGQGVFVDLYVDANRFSDVFTQIITNHILVHLQMALDELSVKDFPEYPISVEEYMSRQIGIESKKTA